MNLKTERIYLRELVESDAYVMKDALSNDEIRYMTNTHIDPSIEDLKKHINRINADEDRVDFAICINSSNMVIGELSILDIDTYNESAGFRIALSQIENISKGYGSEAIKLALAYTFDTLKLNRLQLEVYSFNKRAIKAYKKCGFKAEGELKQAIKIDGDFHDEIIMAILKSEYYKKEQK